MRQLVGAAFSLLFLLFSRFPVNETCGEPTIQPQAGDVTVQAGVFQLDAQGRVIGGNIATAHSWPWMVLLLYKSTSDGQIYMCGATVISGQWLMTAAHCAIDMDVASARAFVGIQSQSETASSNGRRVQTKIVHPSYNGKQLFNDIALLKLSSKLPCSSNVQPICLPFPSNDAALTQPGHNGYVTGWGVYTNNGIVQSGPSANLRQAELPFIDQESCRRKWPIQSSQVCAGAYMSGTGEGDSGGPLEVRGSDQRWYQVGITSYGSNEGNGLIDQGTTPGVYTRVSSYCSFINETTNGDATCSFINDRTNEDFTCSSLGLSISFFLMFCCSLSSYMFQRT